MSDAKHLSVSKTNRFKSNSGALVVGNFLSAALGTRGVCEDLAVHLTGAGWKVFTTSDKPGRIPRLLDMLFTTWSRRREYAVAQVDVYSGLSFIWAEAVCLALELIGKPYVLTLHGGELPEFGQRWPRRVRRLLNSASAVTTPSAYLLEKIAPYHSGLRLQPNPLSLRDYHFRLRNRPKPQLLWLRAFHHIYNPSLAARVLGKLASDFDEIHLTMLGRDKGDGSLEETKEAAAAFSVSDALSLPGKVEKAEIPDWLDQADIFLNTTNVDNAPVSILEAMASGLCIVSTNVGGVPYLLKDEHSALLVPPDDCDAMAAAVRRILTEPDLAENLSRNARNEAEKFDWSVILPDWEDLLSSIAGGRK